jgi:hypothetical protein
MLKLCELYPEDTASEATEVFINAFVTRFQKITLEIAQNQTVTQMTGAEGNQVTASND